MKSNYLSIFLALAANTAALNIPFKQTKGQNKRIGKQINVVKAAANADDDMDLK